MALPLVLIPLPDSGREIAACRKWSALLIGTSTVGALVIYAILQWPI